nr:hypothetical protein [Pantoea dispersa]
MHIVTATSTFIVEQVVIAEEAWLQRFAQRLPLDPIRTLMIWSGAAPDSLLSDFLVFMREIDTQLNRGATAICQAERSSWS